MAAAGTATMAERSGKAAVPWAYLRLPPFPQVAVRVLQLARNENIQLHQLSELISTDPAFAGEVLTVSNSVLYSPRYPLTTIAQAVAVLGANTLQGMCVTVGVRAYLGKAMSYPAMRNLWRHNLACAIVAERIADAGSADLNSAYTAGILHDVGRIALAAIQPKGYAALLEKHAGNAASMMEAERELFGWNHCEVGRQLVGSWKLPESFLSIVALHHEAPKQEMEWDLTELVKTSCGIASSLGFTAYLGFESTPYATLLERLPERQREALHPEAESLRKHIEKAIHEIESA